MQYQHKATANRVEKSVGIMARAAYFASYFASYFAYFVYCTKQHITRSIPPLGAAGAEGRRPAQPGRGGGE